MDKVLVFTSEEKWENLQDDIQERVNWDIFPNEKQPITECVVNSNNEVELSPVKELAHAGIYLVYDIVNMQQLKPLLDNCADDNIYILIHNHGRKMEDFSPWQQQCMIKTGKHENYDKDLYLPTFDIITDANGNKLERIIKKIFQPIKEAALDLLSECLVPKSNLEESDAYFTLCQKEEFRPELEAFKKKYDASESYSDYKEDLDRLSKIINR